MCGRALPAPTGWRERERPHHERTGRGAFPDRSALQTRHFSATGSSTKTGISRSVFFW
ncbi:Uncharacterised protein [Nocardiopsis dassonvillei]|uniref:Uncharacterized protein n=1 Tax=Nocardiopsis dassonvillei (strain ATCC 23218 / DSM 43111 / CIP 107115 / JCM 7437 / KCTC 9190 / NBRC 14626 / NCTC 10488 / NRRL B-5397 / IMRU 509) TaxID=446468 RepID=D7B1U7_NOCDD|nr:hypothetical protein Ndas_1127 [Nocardiopsis dassonvillei subsp. dassonvillei DSM 43111]VEI92590.1 Uncharacterised protein [Nocardiopsis dassonvillei]